MRERGPVSEDKGMLAKAETLIEALPYFQRYAGRTFVVKYGGHAMGDPEAARDFAEDIVLLKAVGINPVVVHGGGPQIGAMLKKLGVESTFVDGLRVTDKATAEIAEMVLSGAINKELVGWIAKAGGKAIGISGKDGGLVTATKVTRTTKDPESNIEQAVDLGFVGEPSHIDTTVLETVSKAGMIPVDRSDRRWGRTGTPTTSTPTRWQARLPLRWAPRGCCCSPMCRACWARTGSC